MIMAYLELVLVLLLSLSSVASTTTPIETSFKECKLTKFGISSKSTESTVLSVNSSLYSQVLESSQQNPRWLNSSSKPLLIITPFHKPEIQAAIICSRKHNLQIRVRSGGHDYEGLSYLCNDPFIIIGGHVGGGGFGTLVRQYGLAAEQFLDAYMIDVDGKLLDRKEMGEDLFWAIRGGNGASFGVILAWKIKLVRVPSIVTGFKIQRTLEQGVTKLIYRWQHIASKLHEDLFIRIIAQNSGGNPKAIFAYFNSLFLGGKYKLIPLMNENFRELGLLAKDYEMSWIQSVLYFSGFEIDNPLEVLLDRVTTYKASFKAKSIFVKDPIPENGLKRALEKLLEEDTVALMIMDPFGGKMDEISESEIAFPHRKGYLYNIQYMVKWDDNNTEASKRHLKLI